MSDWPKAFAETSASPQSDSAKRKLPSKRCYPRTQSKTPTIIRRRNRFLQRARHPAAKGYYRLQTATGSKSRPRRPNSLHPLVRLQQNRQLERNGRALPRAKSRRLRLHLARKECGGRSAPWECAHAFQSAQMLAAVCKRLESWIKGSTPVNIQTNRLLQLNARSLQISITRNPVPCNCPSLSSCSVEWKSRATRGRNHGWMNGGAATS